MSPVVIPENAAHFLLVSERKLGYIAPVRECGGDNEIFSGDTMG